MVTLVLGRTDDRVNDECPRCGAKLGAGVEVVVLGNCLVHGTCPITRAPTLEEWATTPCMVCAGPTHHEVLVDSEEIVCNDPACPWPGVVIDTLD